MGENKLPTESDIKAIIARIRPDEVEGVTYGKDSPTGSLFREEALSYWRFFELMFAKLDMRNKTDDHARRIARIEAVLAALLENASPSEEQRLSEIDCAMTTARRLLEDPIDHDIKECAVRAASGVNCPNDCKCDCHDLLEDK